MEYFIRISCLFIANTWKGKVWQFRMKQFLWQWEPESRAVLARGQRWKVLEGPSNSFPVWKISTCYSSTCLHKRTNWGSAVWAISSYSGASVPTEEKSIFFFTISDTWKSDFELQLLCNLCVYYNHSHSYVSNHMPHTPASKGTRWQIVEEWLVWQVSEWEQKVKFSLSQWLRKTLVNFTWIMFLWTCSCVKLHSLLER